MRSSDAPADSLITASKRAWPYFAPIWTLAALFPVAYTTLAVAQRHPKVFFAAAIAPAWLVAFFLPEVPLWRGQITWRQRHILGVLVPFLIFAATVLVQGAVQVITS